MAITSGATESIRPASLLQTSLSLLLGAAELHELWLRKPFLELDAIDAHRSQLINLLHHRAEPEATEHSPNQEITNIKCNDVRTGYRCNKEYVES